MALTAGGEPDKGLLASHTFGRPTGVQKSHKPPGRDTIIRLGEGPVETRCMDKESLVIRDFETMSSCE